MFDWSCEIGGAAEWETLISEQALGKEILAFLG